MLISCKGCSERVLGFFSVFWGFLGLDPGVYSDEYLTEVLMAEERLFLYSRDSLMP